MRKIIIFSLLVLVLGMTRAQDTIGGQYGKLPGYHYTYWFDNTCSFYSQPYPSLSYSYAFNGTKYYSGSTFLGMKHLARWDSVGHPTGIMGIGVMESSIPPQPTWGGGPRQAEYVYILQYVGTDTLLMLDSVRWDTASYHILRIPTKADTSVEPWYFRFYEVNLSKPIFVDSIFYMTGSTYTNRSRNLDPMMYSCLYCASNRPDNPDWEGGVVPYNLEMWEHTNVTNGTHWDEIQVYGPFFFKVDEVLVKLYTADPAKGTTDPGGMYSKYVEQLIYAYPHRGYRFTHWNDGDTNNPRHITLTQDTILTAYFDTNQAFTVSAVSEIPSMGSVEGDGIYFAHEEATLTAVAKPHYRFTHWNDGDVSNPRRFTVTRDTSFMAFFERIPTYHISAEVNDPEMGYVTGTGTFEEGNEVSLTAITRDYYQYKFIQWNDGWRANPRHFSATTDTSFTAIFASLDGIEQAEAVSFVLAPNPAREYVTITCEEQGKALIKIYDMAGNDVLSRETRGGKTRISTRHLPSGTYFVVLTTAKGSSTQKLVIESGAR